MGTGRTGTRSIKFGGKPDQESNFLTPPISAKHTIAVMQRWQLLNLQLQSCNV